MSSTSQGQVVVATVVFETATSVVDVGVPASIGGVEVASFGADGILSYRPDRTGTVILAHGSVVKGIRQLDPLGNAIDQSLTPAHERSMLMLRAPDGGFITVLHESLDVVEPTERTTTWAGIPSSIGADSYQVFAAINGGIRRWRCPLWSAFVASSPADWAGSPPTDPNTAINRIAAAVAAAHGPIA